jgi:hypothetical protein
VQSSDDSAPSAAAPAPNPNARYNYLVQRLRGRQITMEEATELFGIMDTLVRASEARLAAAVVAGGARPAAAPKPAKKPAAPAAGIPGDELLWLTILGAGAGAGILAAIAKRAGESMQGTPLPGTTSPPRRAT